MIITKSIITNPDNSITEMVFIDDENGHGFSMTKAYYDETYAAVEAKEAEAPIIEQPEL